MMTGATTAREKLRYAAMGQIHLAIGYFDLVLSSLSVFEPVVVLWPGA